MYISGIHQELEPKITKAGQLNFKSPGLANTANSCWLNSSVQILNALLPDKCIIQESIDESNPNSTFETADSISYTTGLILANMRIQEQRLRPLNFEEQKVSIMNYEKLLLNI